MSDEQEQPQTPPPDESPKDASEAPPPEASEEAPEAPCPEPQEQAGEPAEEEQPAPEPLEGAEETAEQEPPAEGEADTEETAESPEEEAPPAEPGPAAKPRRAASQAYDGLEAGLSWFGAEVFEPPVPAGLALALPEGGALAAEALAPGAAAARRQRILSRLDARRKDVASQKRWYQRIPIGAISMLPIVLVLTALMIFYPPWGGLPVAKDALDPKLLTASPVPDQTEVLRQMGVQEAVPNCWRVLPGDVLLMDSPRASAKLVIGLPAGLKDFELSCDACVVDREQDWSLWITLDPTTGIGMKSHPQARGTDYVGGRKRRGGEVAMVGYEHSVKPRHWQQLKIVVQGGSARYVFNGKTVGSSGELAPAAGDGSGGFGKAEVTIFNARVGLRNWTVKPLD